jgi:hypothetical protein
VWRRSLQVASASCAPSRRVLWWCAIAAVTTCGRDQPKRPYNRLPPCAPPSTFLAHTLVTTHLDTLCTPIRCCIFSRDHHSFPLPSAQEPPLALLALRLKRSKNKTTSAAFVIRPPFSYITQPIFKPIHPFIFTYAYSTAYQSLILFLHSLSLILLNRQSNQYATFAENQFGV